MFNNRNFVFKEKESEEYGFTVLRFRDEDILKNIEGVRFEIFNVIERIKPPPP